jgi:hypothetical protein
VRTTWLAPLVLGAVVGIAVADSESGIPMWFRLRDDVAEAAERVQLLARRNAALRDQIQALQGEPFALERAIREDLGLARPGEVVVRFARNGPGRSSPNGQRP